MPGSFRPFRRIWDALVITGTGTYTSETINMPYGHDCSFICSFGGTATGTLIVEVSNSDDDLERLGNAIWTTYDKITIPAIAAPVVHGIELKPLGFAKCRLKYTNATNSGTLTVENCLKARG